MNRTYRTITLPCLILLTAAFIAAGCASTGLQRSEQVQTTMEALNSDIQATAKQLEATASSLENLVQPGQTDFEKAFNVFSENVSKLESTKEDFVSHAEQMEKRGSSYFEEWEKDGEEFENPEIRQLSEERRTKLQNMYEQVTENSIEVSDALDDYVSNVKEIQTYLSNDLTEKGIKGVAPTTKEAISKGYSLQQAIRKVQSNVKRAHSELAHKSTQ